MSPEPGAWPWIAGIDEAGRGPVIGPLVMALVMAEPAVLRRWSALGVTDSKRLTRNRRRELFPIIVQQSRAWSAVSLLPQAIDRHNLQDLMRRVLVHWIRRWRPPCLVLDAPGPKGALPRWHADLRAAVPDWTGELMIETGADRNWTIVGAASIVAKVLRDAAILELRSRFGDFGWGYPSEPRTRQFLQDWFQKYGAWPSWIRSRWGTCQQIRAALQPVRPTMDPEQAR